RAEAALRASERQLTELLEALPVGVFMVKADGTVSIVNQRAKEILEWEAVPRLWPKTLASTLQAHIAGTEEPYPDDRTPIVRALAGETSMIDDIEIRANGRRVPLSVWGAPIRGSDGTIHHAVVAFQD